MVTDESDSSITVRAAHRRVELSVHQRAAIEIYVSGFGTMESSGYFLIGAIVFVLIVIYFSRRDGGATPSLAMWKLIEETILRLQKIAIGNILPLQPPGKIRGFNHDELSEQVATLEGTIRFIYTVESNDDGYVHIVSSQLLRPKPQKYQIESMLVVMMVLNRQLGEAGIEQEDVTFDVSESEMGTHYVTMFLTSAQHEQFKAALKPVP